MLLSALWTPPGSPLCGTRGTIGKSAQNLPHFLAGAGPHSSSLPPAPHPLPPLICSESAGSQPGRAAPPPLARDRAWTQRGTGNVWGKRRGNARPWPRPALRHHPPTRARGQREAGRGGEGPTEVSELQVPSAGDKPPPRLHSARLPPDKASASARILVELKEKKKVGVGAPFPSPGGERN